MLDLSDKLFAINKQGVLERYYGRDEEVEIPYGVTTIGYRAFEKCEYIKRVKIPEGVTGIEDKAFLGCENLESVALPDSLVYIGKFAFLDCKSLRKINFPKTLSIIGDRAFKGCAFEELEIPKHITTIGSTRF